MEARSPLQIRLSADTTKYIITNLRYIIKQIEDIEKIKNAKFDSNIDANLIKNYSLKTPLCKIINASYAINEIFRNGYNKYTLSLKPDLHNNNLPELEGNKIYLSEQEGKYYVLGVGNTLRSGNVSGIDWDELKQNLHSVHMKQQILVITSNNRDTPHMYEKTDEFKEFPWESFTQIRHQMSHRFLKMKDEDVNSITEELLTCKDNFKNLLEYSRTINDKSYSAQLLYCNAVNLGKTINIASNYVENIKQNKQNKNQQTPIDKELEMSQRRLNAIKTIEAEIPIMEGFLKIHKGCEAKSDQELACTSAYTASLMRVGFLVNDHIGKDWLIGYDFDETKKNNLLNKGRMKNAIMHRNIKGKEGDTNIFNTCNAVIGKDFLESLKDLNQKLTEEPKQKDLQSENVPIGSYVSTSQKSVPSNFSLPLTPRTIQGGTQTKVISNPLKIDKRRVAERPSELDNSQNKSIRSNNLSPNPQEKIDSSIPATISPFSFSLTKPPSLTTLSRPNNLNLFCKKNAENHNVNPTADRTKP